MAGKVKQTQKFFIGFIAIGAVTALVINGLMFEQAMVSQDVESSNETLVLSEQKNLFKSLVADKPESTSAETLEYKSQYGELPESLKGTLLHQRLQTDEQGNLRISSDIKRVFDYFLSTIEEEELDVILARIDEYLNYYLQEPALSQSKNILSQYIDLKKALYDFELARSDSLKEMIDSGDLLSDKTRYLALLQEQLEAQSGLRSQYLDAEVYEAFYASEEAYDQYSLARLLVEAEEGLSDEEKSERLAQIDAQTSIELVESRKESGITDELKARVEQVKSNGGGEQEVRAVRVEMFGEEAAERFDALDQERARWQARLDRYLSQRQEILLMEGLSVEERQAQVDTLRSSQFDSREQIRVKVYERKADAERA